MYRIAVVILCLSGLRAGTITTSSSICSAGATTTSGPGGCSVSDPSGANAFATGSGSLTDLSLGPVLQFNGKLDLSANDVQVYGTGIFVPQFPAMASFQINLSEDFVTSGPTPRLPNVR
jgi:hypothetical protein